MSTTAVGRRHHRRGFTLMEMALVIAIIGVLSGIAAPNYLEYLRRAMATEALIGTQSILDLEHIHILETKRAIACDPVPRLVPVATSTTFVATQSWRDLGYLPAGKVRFQYEVEVIGRRSFIVHARGDLDGDGVLSEYSLDSRDRTLTIHNGRE